MANLCSCVEEYNAELPDSEEQVLVVEGNIVSDCRCTFTLRMSVSMNESTGKDQRVRNAKISVEGDDGQKFDGYRSDDDEYYYVNVGHLDPNHKYHLNITTGGSSGNPWSNGWGGTQSSRHYESEPMYPLSTPAPTELQYVLSQEGKVVDVCVSTEDPQSDEVTYFRWDYEETWELVAPHHPVWEWDPGFERYQRITVDRSRAWSYQYVHPAIVGNNADFDRKSLNKLKIYSYMNTDNRFNKLYHTVVTQSCISRQEYEYINVLNKQSTDMGGLFSPMPSELPTNITCTDHDVHVIGFVGVRANTRQASLWITREGVGYHTTHGLKYESFDGPPTQNPYTSYKYGYRVEDYIEGAGTSQWTYRWVVDACDPVWGGKTYEKPSLWPDK